MADPADFGLQLDAWVAGPPEAVEWDTVTEFADVDRRIAAVAAEFASAVGVHDSRLLWRPAGGRPPAEEALAWLWVVRPDLIRAAAADAPERIPDSVRRLVQR